MALGGKLSKGPYKGHVWVLYLHLMLGLCRCSYQQYPHSSGSGSSMFECMRCVNCSQYMDLTYMY